MRLKEGDLVIFQDHQKRSYRQVLHPHGRLQTHWGYIDHQDLIGGESGRRVLTTKGKELFMFRPTLVDYTMKMHRMSGIIYPKDTAYMLLWGDVHPGVTVVHGGVGSGALTLALTRQVGPTGRVIGYDVRQDMLDCATRNVTALFGGMPPQLTLKLGDVYREIEERDANTLMLDVPEPWEAIGPVTGALKPGGMFVAYMPTIRQVEILTTELRASGAFAMVNTVEILVRDWHIEGKSIRPGHRMVGHTGFITAARRIMPAPGAADKDGVNATWPG